MPKITKQELLDGKWIFVNEYDKLADAFMTKLQKSGLKFAVRKFHNKNIISKDHDLMTLGLIEEYPRITLEDVQELLADDERVKAEKPKRCGEFWNVVMLCIFPDGTEARHPTIITKTSIDDAVSYTESFIACGTHRVLAIVPASQFTWREGEGLELLGKEGA